MGRYYKVKPKEPVPVSPRDVGLFAFCSVKWHLWRKTSNLSPSQLRRMVQYLSSRSDLSMVEKRDLNLYRRLVEQQSPDGSAAGAVFGKSKALPAIDPATKFLFILGTTCAALALVALF